MIATSVHISRRNHPKPKTQNSKLKTVKEACLGGLDAAEVSFLHQAIRP